MADNCAVMVIVPDSPALACEAVVKVTVGAVSSSVMVAVCVVMAPCVAFVGVPMSTITVSSASSMASVAMVMVMLAVVLLR
jgi:hypothetical protein